jgi:predicted transcriptional regulator
MFSSRQKFIDLLHAWRISKTDVAGIVGVVPARVSDYCQDKSLPPERVSQIENAISEIVEVYETFYPFRIEASDPEIFRSAVLRARLTRSSREATEAISQLARYDA